MASVSELTYQAATASQHGGGCAAAFKAAMRRLASHVCVITSGAGDQLTGITVTSVTSLSAEPPAIMLGVAGTSSLHPVLERTGLFAVNALVSGDEGLANRFAGRDGAEGAARYEAGSWCALDTGAPRLVGAAFTLTCAVDRMIGWHDHSIVVGRVLEAHHDGSEPPALLYRNGHYGAMSAPG